MLDEQIRVGMGEKFLGKYDGKWNLSKDTYSCLLDFDTEKT